MPLLAAANLHKTYVSGDARVHALAGVSFDIEPGDFVALMGPSGCGKSTLMDALNGLRPATEGAVFIDELNLYQNFDAVRRSIGYVPQRDVLHDSLTAERTLHYAARLRLPEQTAPEEMARVVDETLRAVGLAEHRLTEFQQLSGGQQKRLSLALELLTKPSFLFLDEPTSP
jgi:ABC-type multidrug transport system ATPase subunit